MRKRFRLAEIPYNDRTCIIIISIEETTVGLIVDEVSEVLDIPSDQIDPAPHTSKSTRSRYIDGIGKIGENVKIILNINKLLTADEITEVSNVG